MQKFDRHKNLILIAEDDPDDRLMLTDAFAETSEELNLEFVNNGEDLCAYLDRGKQHALPDLIILDLNMPRMDGHTVLRTVKDDPRTRAIPVIVLTTSKAETDQKSVLELGALGFYTKPSSFPELIQITSSILHQWLPNRNSLNN